MNESYNPDIFEEILLKLTPILGNYLRESAEGKRKVLSQKSIEAIAKELDFDRLITEGNGDFSKIIPILLENSNHLQHPHYMGHQVAVPMISSAFADLINGMTNNAMAIYEMGPAGTAIERKLIQWMLSKIGWESGGDGVMTHGGSLANLSCLLAARAKALPQSWEEGVPSNCVFLMPESAHYSLTRAVSILGFGSNAIVKISVDRNLRIKTDAFKEAFRKAKSDGKKIVAAVVSAGSTATGIFDPILEIAEFCRDEECWLHIDGAHGGAVLISEKYRGLLEGIKFADSLTWDTHKMLATSTLCGVCLFRDGSTLKQSYSQQASYLFNDQQKPGEDLSKNTFECTKALLSLKLFFNLAFVGERGLAQHVDHLFDRTLQFYEYINSRSGFECLMKPQANILCFRYGRDSKVQDHLRNELVMEGDFYITRTEVHGETWLRLVIMNPLTNESHIKALCDRLEVFAKKLH